MDRGDTYVLTVTASDDDGPDNNIISYVVLEEEPFQYFEVLPVLSYFI